MTQPLFGAMPSSSSIKRRRQLADALLSNATDASPVGHWTQALARGLQGGIAGWQSGKADKEEASRSQALANALGGNMSPEEMQNFGLTNDMPDVTQVGTSRMKAADDNSKYGNSLYTIKGPNGELRYVQPYSGGGTQEVQLPPGFQPTETINYLNQGTQFGGMGSKSGTPGPTIPINNAAEAEQTATGKGMAERTLGRPEATARLNNIDMSLTGLKNSVDLLDKSEGFDRIFGVMGVFPNMPGGAAADAQTFLSEVTTKLSAKALQDMREASKTGGAVGQVTEREWPRLESLIANLAQSQSAAQARQNLQRIKDQLDSTRQNIKAAYDSMYGDGGGSDPQNQDDPLGLR